MYPKTSAFKQNIPTKTPIKRSKAFHHQPPSASKPCTNLAMQLLTNWSQPKILISRKNGIIPAHRPLLQANLSVENHHSQTKPPQGKTLLGRKKSKTTPVTHDLSFKNTNLCIKNTRRISKHAGPISSKPVATKKSRGQTKIFQHKPPNSSRTFAIQNPTAKQDSFNPRSPVPKSKQKPYGQTNIFPTAMPHPDGRKSSKPCNANSKQRPSKASRVQAKRVKIFPPLECEILTGKW